MPVAGINTLIDFGLYYEIIHKYFEQITEQFVWKIVLLTF